MHTIAAEETFTDGQLIFRENSPGDWVYIILSGEVEISKTVEGRSIVIEILREGEVFGELGFLGGIKRTAAARAIGDTTLGVIDKIFLDSEFNKLSTEFRSILVAVARRFKKMVDRMSESSQRQAPRAMKILSLAYKDRQSFVKAFSSNVGPGGLFIKTDNPLPQGEEFQLKLQLPDIPEPLLIQCQVAWNRNPSNQQEGRPVGMGVEFKQMSPRDEQVFKNFVLQIMPKW